MLQSSTVPAYRRSASKLCVVCLLCLASAGLVSGEYYSSINEISKLVKYEGFLLNNLEKFIAKYEGELDFLKNHLNEYERERDEALLEGPSYFDNPVNKYLLTKRLTVDWERIENLMEHKSGEKELAKLEKLVEKFTIKHNAEVEGAAEGLLRLQDIYRLATKDIAAGILQGVSYGKELSARHCFAVGKHGITYKKFKLAHSWFTQALERLETEKATNNIMALIEEPLDESDILFHLANAKHLLGDLVGANQTYNVLLESWPESEKFAKAYAEFSTATSGEKSVKIDYSSDHAPIPENLLYTDDDDRYKLTCSGHIRQTPSEERYLRCGYLSETHPFLILAPLKVEELNHDPLLVVFYDVIYDSEIAVIKNLTQSSLQRATVMGVNDSIVSPVRVSQFVFLPKTRHQVLKTIDQRVEDMTNLNMTYAEEHQFANYGIGGHYAQHHDWFVGVNVSKLALAEMGDRIGTVLFYLTDVEQGGGTAFPYLKRLLMPKKGSAVFWHNLHASGEGDLRTLHGGCPIIVGSKWVQNRWIREYFQDRRPCELFNDKVYGPF